MVFLPDWQGANIGTLVADVAALQVATGPHEAVHYVGQPGEPAFENAWVSIDAGTPGTPGVRAPGFYKDRGRVYLSGGLNTGTGAARAFTLPAGYRPLAPSDTRVHNFATGRNVEVDVTGAVTPDTAGLCMLDSVSFRAAP
jgi:hypothetical protein